MIINLTGIYRIQGELKLMWPLYYVLITPMNEDIEDVLTLQDQDH